MMNRLRLVLCGTMIASLQTGGTCGQPASAAETPAPLAVTGFTRAVRLQADGADIDLKSHVATRCYDADGDGVSDLFLAAGDGRLWMLANIGTRTQPRFAKPVPVLAGTRNRWGSSYTGIALAQVIGSPLPDLVVAHSDRVISIHENTGVKGRPKFRETSLDVSVQRNCQGRFDVADCNGDGLLDLVTGSFGGTLQWHRNTGTVQQPEFAAAADFEGIRQAYNAHPRLLKFNDDDLPDLLLGVNWGTVSLYLNSGSRENPVFENRSMFSQADGSQLNIRELNGDDTTPELVDLDGDGVLDLVSGGKNGHVFFLKGLSPARRIEEFAETLARHRATLAKDLQENAVVREQLLGALQLLQADLGSGLLSQPLRQGIYEKLVSLADRFEELRSQRRDPQTESTGILLAAQFQVVLFEALPDSPEHRERIAGVLQLDDGHRKLLTDFGVLFFDNMTATPQQLDAMHELIAALPAGIWDVETITAARWLGPAIKQHKLRSRAGINIFDMPLGRAENSFANDAPRAGLTDIYLICLGHELAHNMLDTVGRRLRPELYEYKFAGLARAAGDAVVYQQPMSNGIDMPATKRRFQERGWWDGQADSWNAAWKKQFDDDKTFQRAHVRGNIRFFLDAPQEAFATLANQYLADSQLMLEFSKGRYDAGHSAAADQFLLIVDYFSKGTDQVPFYTLRPGGDLTTAAVVLKRDPAGRIVELKSRSSLARFTYEGDRMVRGFTVESREAALAP